jgi:glucosamine--fructose-6-phosphate aminotransferase (isomerizing)
VDNVNDLWIADFMHGPIALVERDFPVFVLMPPGKTFAGLKHLVTRLQGLRAETLVVSSAQARLPAGTRVIRVPGSIHEIYSPIPYIVPGQIFAGLLAEVKGIDPDKPRSLHIVTRTV